MNAIKADRWTGNITTVGGCTVGAVLLGGSVAGEVGALIGNSARPSAWRGDCT